MMYCQGNDNAITEGLQHNAAAPRPRAAGGPRREGLLQARSSFVMSKYQQLRPLTPREREGLKESIREHGVLVPVLKDEHGNVIDGHHRQELCDELRIECPFEVRAG